MIKSTVNDINSRISTPGSGQGSMIEVRAQKIMAPKESKKPESMIELKIKKVQEMRAKKANAGSVLEVRESKPLVRNQAGY